MQARILVRCAIYHSMVRYAVNFRKYRCDRKKTFQVGTNFSLSDIFRSHVHPLSPSSSPPQRISLLQDRDAICMI